MRIKFLSGYCCENAVTASSSSANCYTKFFGGVFFFVCFFFFQKKFILFHILIFQLEAKRPTDIRHKLGKPNKWFWHLMSAQQCIYSTPALSSFSSNLPFLFLILLCFLVFNSDVVRLKISIHARWQERERENKRKEKFKKKKKVVGSVGANLNVSAGPPGHNVATVCSAVLHCSSGNQPRSCVDEH